MADLTTAGSYFQTYDNTGTGVAASKLGFNIAAKEGQGIAGRTRVISLSKSNMTQAELDAAIRALQLGGTSGTDDAVTIVGISSDGGDAGGDTNFVTGQSDVVYVAVQGTGTLTAGSDYRGVTGVTMALVADFKGLQK